MTISERYRQLLELIEQKADEFYEELPEDMTRALRYVDQAAEEMQEWSESIGEIPQLQLENKISPVLLKAHSLLDRARVILEENEHNGVAEIIWEQEQLIYRLLNDL